MKENEGSNEGYQIIGGVKTDRYLHYDVWFEDEPELLKNIEATPEPQRTQWLRKEVDKRYNKLRGIENERY